MGRHKRRVPLCRAWIIGTARVNPLQHPLDRRHQRDAAGPRPVLDKHARRETAEPALATNQVAICPACSSMSAAPTGRDDDHRADIAQFAAEGFGDRRRTTALALRTGSARAKGDRLEVCCDPVRCRCATAGWSHR